MDTEKKIPGSEDRKKNLDFNINMESKEPRTTNINIEEKTQSPGIIKNDRFTANEDTESIDGKKLEQIVSETENVSQESSLAEDILSPPKSETQTDGTNTSSPPSESQLSPVHSALANLSPLNPSVVIQPLSTVSNGVIPKSGKPLMAAMNKKYIKPRGRPKRVKALVAMYQSEISDNKIGIKLCIKKSETAQTTSKPSRKRSRKSKRKHVSDSDDSEYEAKKRKEKSNNNTSKQKKEDSEYKEPTTQSVWGELLPHEILYKIFQELVQKEGCLPTLVRLGRVCKLWRKVSLNSSLWKTLDLSTWMKEKHRTELKLKWLIENRLSCCTELNVSNWKVSDIQCVLNKLADNCPNIVGLTLSGWKELEPSHLAFIAEEFSKLERLDLSSINDEVNYNKSAVALPSLCNAIQLINGRLTQLNLAHNRLAGIAQILTALAAHCPNLAVLDLSNVRTIAISHSILHVEKLQHGCPKLKVLRITSSRIMLSSVTLQEQMDSPGFPELEELSVASLANQSRDFNDEFLQRILKTSTKLKLLDVRGCARLTHESLIRLPAWDLRHLFLSGCSVTKDLGSRLELIASKWAHSLIEFDLAWTNVQEPLDNALRVLAEKGAESPLTHLNLCGSSVSEAAVKEILSNCPLLNSINLSSCRGLPRGVKRLISGSTEIRELREVLKAPLKMGNAVKKEENTK